MTRVQAHRLSELHAELARVYAEMAEPVDLRAHKKRPRIPVEISDVDVALAKGQLRRLRMGG